MADERRGAEERGLADPPRLCLTMIVKDESRVLRRCLDSCATLVEAACVCDTGSTDGTRGVAETFARERGLPLAFESHPWVDFGHNRTRALDAARALVNRLGWPAASTWLLLLDADQVLEDVASFDRRTLALDAYSLRQRSGDATYWNVRLVRADRPWRYAGATHEHVVFPAGARSERLPAPTVLDKNDGGSRGDKFPRDLRLLTAALERDPDDVRTLFYLARTYRALGDRLRALALFRRRIERGGWSEEVWHSWLATAEIHRDEGDRPRARAALLAALRVEPRRAEAHHLLAVLHREEGRPARAAAAARRGLSLPYPESMGLFVDRRPYDFGLREELALSAAGTRHAATGFDAADALVLDPRTPHDVRARGERALLRYVAPIEGAVHVALSPSLEEPWAPCNPCVVARGDGYLVNVRAVNYRQTGARAYRIADPAGIVRSRNVLVDLDADLRPTAQREVHGAPPAPRASRIAGFEDVRLLPTPEGLFAIATTADRHPGGRIGPSLLRLGGDGRVEEHRPVTGFGEDRVQKNWLPFLDEATGEARLLYAVDPPVVLALDLATGRCRPIAEGTVAREPGRLRGSAGPLPFEGAAGPGRLVLAHEVVLGPDGARRYLHRFVWRSADGTSREVSRPFVFRSLGIEFAAGACLDAGRRSLLVSYGVEDREAWLARIPVETVRGLLRPSVPAARRDPREADARGRRTLGPANGTGYGPEAGTSP